MTVVPMHSTTSTTTTASTCSSPSISLKEQVFFKELVTLYGECIGPVTDYVLHLLKQEIIINHVPRCYFAYAIRETALAPMPSLRYMLAIVQRLKRERVSPDDDIFL